MNIYSEYIHLDNPISGINFTQYRDRKNNLHCDDILVFDIETTSAFQNSQGELFAFNKDLSKEYYTGCNKYALCYLWSACINDNAYYGRTLESFIVFLNDIEKYMPDIRKYIYVHNLSFEFMFLINVMDNIEVFARKEHKPIYFRWKNFEFRCSYLLTNMSLETWGEQKQLKHKKLVGTIDYNIIRTPLTKLSSQLLDYSIADVRVMVDGLREYKDRYRHIKDIPLTQTGIVRKEFTKRLIKRNDLHKKCTKLIPKTVDEYKLLVDVFGGGLTRSNYINTDIVISNLRNRDKTSAYPYEMLVEKFPCSKFIKSNTDRWLDYYNNRDFAYIIDVTLCGVERKYWNTFLSGHKPYEKKGVLYDNGRILSAKSISLKCLDLDFENILESYYIKEIKINNLWYAVTNYLDDDIRKFVLELFRNKTLYRDIEGKEDTYMRAKEMLNSLYGMAVTRDLTDSIIFTKMKEWKTEQLNTELFEKLIDIKKSKSYKNNMTYAQGVWIPAYQRDSLWSFVYLMDSDIVYMDTDSVKYIDESNDILFENHNKEVRKKQVKIANQLGIDVDMLRPVSPKGIICSLGEYTDEGIYDRFKTLGAKRYAYEKNGQLYITVSGVNKKKGRTQIDSVDSFSDGLIFDIEHSGKMIMHYLEHMESIVYNEGKYDEYLSNYQYGICSQPTEYKMKLGSDYAELLESIKGTLTSLFVEGETEK